MNSTFLTPEQIPPEVQEVIDKVYKKLLEKDYQWGCYNGASEYLMANVKERALIKKIIEDECHHRKEFYLLDIGPGQYTWSHETADYLNKSLNVPDDVIIHIIGVSGERNTKEKFHEKGRCRVYDLGEFKVENMLAEFKKPELQKYNLNVDNNIDFITSHACLYHLVNPVGTFLQVYNELLRAEGYFIFDNFRFDLYDDKTESLISDKKLTISMLLEADIPFLLLDTHSDGYINSYEYIVQKKSKASFNLSYVRLEHDNNLKNYSRCVTIFRSIDASKIISPSEINLELYDVSGNSELNDGEKVCGSMVFERHGLQGNKSLYESLCQSKLFILPTYAWKSIYLNKRDRTEKFPLHEAVKSGNEAEVRALLETNNVNQSDYTGNTPTHLSIQNNQFEIFKLLLSLKPNLDLFNYHEQDVLRTAIICDKQGEYISLLIAAGVCLIPGERYCFDKPPLVFAEKQKNHIAIEKLQEAIKQHGMFNAPRTYYQETSDVKLATDWSLQFKTL